jgi:hypothetical protein
MDGSSMTMWINFLVQFAHNQDNHNIIVVGNKTECSDTSFVRNLVYELMRRIPAQQVGGNNFVSNREKTQVSDLMYSSMNCFMIYHVDMFTFVEILTYHII